MDSMDYPPPSPFICPAKRTGRIGTYGFQENQIGEATYRIIDNSYHISDTQDGEYSHSHQLYLLYWCNNKDSQQNNFFCWACVSDKFRTNYYFCYGCRNSYHKECVESPPVFIFPYHPKYPLQLIVMNRGHRTCHLCGLILKGLSYYSSIFGLFLDPVCAIKRDLASINNPERHEHVLHYLPRKASLTCDVCGLDDNKHRFYVCLQCGFVVHITCIYLPRVILISFHNHRLSFTSSLSSENWFCGVCRRKIDENYGEYSCTKGCAYAVHSKCATRRDVWDGKELEDQPEMVYDNLKPFEEMGDGIIQHFSHVEHLMRLDEDNERVYDEGQHCKACVLPFYDETAYICMQCDFALHEACATLPRRKQTMVHPHWFTLKPNIAKSSFHCKSCRRESCGFRYVCCEGCEYEYLDVRCASLPGRLGHQSHPHPLFLIYERGFYQTCSTCGNRLHQCINCVECDFALCFRCATLPYKVKDEDDEHMLTLSYEKSASGHLYLCQVCEETIDPKKGYFGCNECGVTLHIECILGTDNPYMKAGQIIKNLGTNIEIIPNNRLSRLICNKCHRRCQYKIAYKTTAGNIICSLGEAEPALNFERLEAKQTIWPLSIST